jgi:ABC-type Fe3+ transport system substrate-binding protein
VDWVALEPAVISVNTVMAGAKAMHPNAARLFIDFTLSKEGQEKLWDFQRIPARSDVEPKPARLFRGLQTLRRASRRDAKSRRDSKALFADSQNALSASDLLSYASGIRRS